MADAMEKGIGSMKTLIVFLALTGTAFAQASEHDKSACRSVVVRFCRHDLASGPFTVLACLRANRTYLSKTCRKVLDKHGV